MDRAALLRLTQSSKVPWCGGSFAAGFTAACAGLGFAGAAGGGGVGGFGCAAGAGGGA